MAFHVFSNTEINSKKIINLGLYEKKYAPDDSDDKEYPFSEKGDNGEIKKYKKVPIEISDAACDKITKLSEKSYENENKIDISKVLKVVAWVILIGGFIWGIVAGISVNTLSYYLSKANEYEFSFFTALLYWAGAFISSMVFFGFARIIRNQERTIKENFRNTQLLSAELLETIRFLNEIKNK